MRYIAVLVNTAGMVPAPHKSGPNEAIPVKTLFNW